MSPASRAFDALGLVKQINEQSAAALEEAHEVLASGSPWKRHCKENNDKENTAWKNEVGTSKPPSKPMVCKLPTVLAILIIAKSKSSEYTIA